MRIEIEKVAANDVHVTIVASPKSKPVKHVLTQQEAATLSRLLDMATKVDVFKFVLEA